MEANGETKDILFIVLFGPSDIEFNCELSVLVCMARWKIVFSSFFISLYIQFSVYYFI